MISSIVSFLSVRSSPISLLLATTSAIEEEEEEEDISTASAQKGTNVTHAALKRAVAFVPNARSACRSTFSSPFRIETTVFFASSLPASSSPEAAARRCRRRRPRVTSSPPKTLLLLDSVRPAMIASVLVEEAKNIVANLVSRAAFCLPSARGSYR
jgi:hypothetical protein